MSEYLALRDGARGFRQGFTGPVLLRIPTGRFVCVYRTITFFGAAFQTASSSLADPLCGSYNPGEAVTSPVWASPRSLATTRGITVVFFSTGYLDVSVPRVGSDAPMDSVRSDVSSTRRVVPFGNPRIRACLQLPAAYRSLSRPSSPAHAKASTIRHK